MIYGLPQQHRGPIYISGPMSGYKDWNFPAFNYVTEVLRTAGFNVISPSEFGAETNTDWIDCLKRDLRLMCDCTAVIMLPGWTKSRGARLERHVADTFGFPIWELAYFLEMPENKFPNPREIVLGYLERSKLLGVPSTKNW